MKVLVCQEAFRGSGDFWRRWKVMKLAEGVRPDHLEPPYGGSKTSRDAIWVYTLQDGKLCRVFFENGWVSSCREVETDWDDLDVPEEVRKEFEGKNE